MAEIVDGENFDFNAYVEGHLAHYRDSFEQLVTMRGNIINEISNDKALKPLVHSIRSRIKDETHLADKLKRKYDKQRLIIPQGDLLKGVNDIIGIRVLYLHRDQIRYIDSALSAWADQGSYRIIEGPIAMVFDDETAGFFENLGMKTERRTTLYTSVHYVLESYHKKPYTFEIQARTLLEEEWGEIEHSINYPVPTDSLACSEQLKAFAHLTNGCVRLVGSIIRSHEDHKKSKESTPHA
ncbi:MAG TPA: (p)ppGpp synthetase [bacterium]|jgi:ppGpp synthetase/RelA/SpoT-type nucleotidyltranferase